MKTHYDVIIIGGGAAGFFTAINAKENNPNLSIAILERGKTVLEKVRVSGGGRCNVTHACFDPKELVKHYPRGEKELLGPFHQFSCGDTIEWFENKGVELKIEDDGRMFPITDNSQTIIDCFLHATNKLKIDVITSQSVKEIYKAEKYWKIDTNQQQFTTEKLVIATGSNTKIWNLLEELGHTIITPVPSLFTFNIQDKALQKLMGVSSIGTVTIPKTNLEASGPILVTHWGLSGPGILRLSAWGARILHEKNYQFPIEINWTTDKDFDDVLEELKVLKIELAKKNCGKTNPYEIPNRLWEFILLKAEISPELKWADFSKTNLINLAEQLTKMTLYVNGKSTFKEEFVTAGGVDLKEINFKTMESKIIPSLYLVGEILNIDAITGGFNFQNAWTGGYIAGKNISSSI